MANTQIGRSILFRAIRNRIKRNMANARIGKSDDDYVQFIKLYRSFISLFKTRLRIFSIIVALSLMVFMYSAYGLFYNWKFYTIKSKRIVEILMVYINYLISVFKVIIILLNANRMLKIFDITRYNFLKSLKLKILNCKSVNLQSRNMVFCKRFLFLYMFNLIVWIFCPLVYNFTTSKHDLTDFQRLGVVNFYLPLSKKSYNKYFYLNYAVESMFAMTIAVFLLSFDMFYFTICTAIAAQYETIISGLKKFGHNRINKTDGTQMYEELKIIISDYQNVHLYMKEFCLIVRPVVLVEVFLCFCSIATCSYIMAVQIVTHSFNFADFLPVLTSMVSYCILLFIYLYFTDLMNEKRDGVNFGLYSCDWTAMDVRFKKLLILAMAMNNANQLKIKATPNRVINLELFLVVLRTSYTIVSFMVNAKLSSSDNVN